MWIFRTESVWIPAKIRVDSGQMRLRPHRQEAGSGAGGEGPREAGGEREWGGEGTQEGVCCGEKQEAGRCGCGRKAMHTWPNIPGHWLT